MDHTVLPAINSMQNNVLCSALESSVFPLRVILSGRHQEIYVPVTFVCKASSSTGGDLDLRERLAC